MQSLPEKLKKVSIIDDTEEAYYKHKGYDASLYQTLADTFDESEETELGVVPGESCNENNNVVPTVEIHETVPDEQTSADPFNSRSTGYIEHITTEQGGVSQIYKEYNSLKEMPGNINDVNQRLKYHCSMQSPPKGLMKAEHLQISLCKCSKELLANLKESMNLLHLAIKDCSQHHVKKLPTNLNELANLKTLSIRCTHIESLPSFAGLSSLLKLYIGGVSTSSPRLEKLPADLDNLDKLLAIDIHDTKIKCLPWSIKNLQKFRFLFLPLDFRLETLPCQLFESVIITVEYMHIRKTWKELKTEMGLLSCRGVGVNEAQNFSTISSAGYLRLKEDPRLWIMKNYDLCVSVQSLELELSDDVVKIGDSIEELRKLTYLYISGNNYLNLKHLPDTSTTLRHLSFQNCNIESLSDSLGKLSNLESLCLDLQNTSLPKNLDLLINLRHLSLQYGQEQSAFDGLEKLSNLKALDLFQCDIESFPENLHLNKLKLSNCNFSLLPLSLCHLEILHSNDKCNNGPKCAVSSLSLNQLVFLETLFITCSSMEILHDIGSLQNLQELQLKDCLGLKALPENLDKLIRLRSLDISGTKIESLPDSISKLLNLQQIVLPKCFKQDLSHKFSGIGCTKVSIDDTDGVSSKDMSSDDDDFEAFVESNNDDGFEALVESNNKPAESYSSLHVEESSVEDRELALQDIQMGNMIAVENQLMIAPKGLHISSSDKGSFSNGGNTLPASEREQNSDFQSHNAKDKRKKKKIPLEAIQELIPKRMTLVDAAMTLGVSRSTMKRTLKEYDITWPSSRTGKQRDSKKRKQNTETPSGSNLAATLETFEEPSTETESHIDIQQHEQGHLNPALHSTKGNYAATLETFEEPLMVIESHMDTQQQAQGHLEGTLHSTESNRAATLEETFDPMVIESHMDIQQQVQGHLEGTLHSTESSGTIVVKATYKEL
ncbi:leucine-rich repeat and death domain-containing protein 1-like [Chenopodium quinoa]|uniref:leucine-rich repeat and death domain-containing protein 1-like n=1 Tax=Chenopodium quinoa TaxID=63459 RepID=UPI000B787901|nr:leucine-rich repeat and death domain-containing protein 1-like [Chenopodium quinoa]